MARRIPTRRHARRTSQPDLERIVARLETAEQRLVQVQNTLDGVAREAGVSIGCPCSRCDRSYLLVKGGALSCPLCGYTWSM